MVVVPLVAVMAAVIVPSSFSGPGTSTAAVNTTSALPSGSPQPSSTSTLPTAGPTVGTTDPAAAPPSTTPIAPGLAVAAGVDQTDPVLYATEGRYFLFASNKVTTPALNVPVSSATTFGSWSPVTDAMPAAPAWSAPGYTWSPDVHQFGSTYVLYFTAKEASTGKQCLGLATSRVPVGPYAAAATPLICQRELGGDIDPRVFTDTDGSNWLLWKSDQNAGGTTIPTELWSQRLSADGSAVVGAPSVLMRPDEPWQGTIVEAPDMVKVHGTYWVFYSGNWFNHAGYAIGAARCQGPQGPCADTSTRPLLSSNAQGIGPGEASVFAAPSGYWMLYTPVLGALYVLTRPIYITRIGFGAAGPYLAAGGPPPSLDPLAGSVWSAT